MSEADAGIELLLMTEAPEAGTDPDAVPVPAAVECTTFDLLAD